MKNTKKMADKKKRKLIGKGISDTFGGFPKELKIGKTYELEYDSEIDDYIVENKYKSKSFEWDKSIPSPKRKLWNR